MKSDVEAYLDREEIFHLLSKLVAAPTVNPPGDEHLGFEAIEPELHRIGFKVEKFPTSSGRINLIAWWPECRQGEKTFLFNGHMDVVPTGDLKRWNFDPFHATRFEGKIYGRGTADMKGSIAAIIESVALLQRGGLSPDNGCVSIHLVSDEEVLGTEGTKFLLDSGRLNADLAVVGEPSTGQIAIAARGVIWAAIEVIGKAAHGSVPHLGINAVEAMYDYLNALPALPNINHTLLGKPTRNLGLIRGGEKVNMVPATCHAEIDRRTLPQERARDVQLEFLRTIEVLKRQDSALNASVDFFCSAESSEIALESDVVKLAQRATEIIRGRPATVAGFPGATDARFLINQRRIPTIIYGVGDLEQAHTADEHIREDDLCEMTLIYAEMIKSFLGTPGAGRRSAPSDS